MKVDLSETVNCDAVLNQFHLYLTESKANVQDAFELVLQDAIDEELSEDEMASVVGILIDEIVCRFADRYDSLDNCYDGNPDPNSVFQTFCTFEKINEDLANTIADVINKAVAHDHEAVDVDDAGVIFNGERDWQKLPPEERQAKVKAFLKKIAHGGLDAVNLKPFIRNASIGDQPGPYGNRFGTNESIYFPDHHGTGYDELHRAHPLHKTLQKFGYAYSHTIPVTKGNGVHHHHTWTHPHGFQVGSYEGSTEFSSKTHAGSGHVFTGIGLKSLEFHLSNRAKRYKLSDSNSLPNTKIMEGLSDDSRVQFYKRWMEQNPERAWGVEGSYRADSPAKDLIEAAKLKAEAEKKFGQRKDPSEWGLFDYRSGKPR